MLFSGRSRLYRREHREQRLAGNGGGGGGEIDGALTICRLWPISRVRRVDSDATVGFLYVRGIVFAALSLYPLDCLCKADNIRMSRRVGISRWVDGWVSG